MGCEFLQGYGIARPMSAVAATEWIKSYAAKEPVHAAIG
jgi:EAL domain-containing protein (putative c-di-GMP-specific phosphodiesterase class I)